MIFLPLVTVSTVAAVVFAIAGLWFGRRALRRHVDKGHHEVLVALFQTGGTLHAVFLAFLVVAVWQSYDAARANVAEEASSLTTLYRATAAMDPGAGARLRTLLRGYAQAVVDREWKVQAERGAADPGARAASLAMYRVFREEDATVKQNDSAINGAALELVSQIQSDRNRRTLQAGQSLPAIIWFAAIGSSAIVVSMSFFLVMEQARPQFLATSMMAGTIGLLLCITFILSRPFSGPMALRPDPFAHSLEVFDSVDAML